MNIIDIIEWMKYISSKMAKAREPVIGYIPPPPKPPIEILKNVTLPAIDIVKSEFDPTSFEKPVLWKYNPDKSHNIWIAQNYQDYIMSDNELVMHFADSIEFIQGDTTISIKFKDTGNRVRFKYRIDDARLCDESGQSYSDCYSNRDFWLNPDYYIWNGFEGDCEDYALLMASVFEYLGIPYMYVVGLERSAVGSIKDAWVEFVYNNEAWIMQVNLNRGCVARKLSAFRSAYTPYKMLNKTTEICKYHEWYETQ